MPPTIRAFISPEELYPGRVVEYDELAALAATLNRHETLHFLGFLNLLLSCATTEAHLTNQLEPVRDVQHWLFREVVSERLLHDLKAKFRNASLLDRPILHRTQMMFAIRLVATHGDPDAGNRLVDRGDFDAIGDLLFLINGLFRVDPATNKILVPAWLAAQMGPLHELENPPPLELTWPRTEELLIQRLPAVAADPAELERLEQVTVFTSGFSLRAWIDLSWIFMSFWITPRYRDLMADRARGYLNPDAPHSVISVNVLRRAVDGLAIRFDELPAYLRIETYSRNVLFDLTLFRTRPLWIMPDGLVLCIDASLLMERLGPHAFWTVMNALDSAERRQQFSRTWGLAFESYVLDAFAQICGSKKWLYVRNPMDETNNEEMWDAFASRDGTVVLIECKGTFMRSVDKYSGVTGRFFRGLSQKFGRAKGGGVHQLIRGISRIWFERAARGPVAKPGGVTDVFPVLVVQDPILECGPVARVLSDRFQTALARLRRPNHSTPKIWPLTVITANELDVLAANMPRSGQRLDSLLKRFHRLHPSRMVSLGDFLSSGEARDFGFPEAGREVIRERFRTGTEASLDRFRNAEYGRAIDVLAEVAADGGNSVNRDSPRDTHRPSVGNN
jgi:hypothetical protein